MKLKISPSHIIDFGENNRMPRCTLEKIKEIRKITEPKHALKSIVDLIKNYVKLEERVPIQYNPKTGKPIKFEWRPAEYFKWEIYLCLGSDECITPGLSGEVIKFVKENSPLLVKTNFGKYIFRYEERSGFCDEQGGGISEYKKCLVLIEKLKELKGKE